MTLYKNNVDGKGATYGMHENYLVDRAVPFSDLAARLIPFFVTRQVFTGAGRVGLGQRGEERRLPAVAARGLHRGRDRARDDAAPARSSTRATSRTPTRTRWRRLHVIIGDATMLEVATYLRLGTASLVLWLIERAVAEGGAGGALGAIDRLTLRDPVQAVHLVSHDLTLTTRLELADGRRLTALEIQREYLDAVRAALAHVGDALDEQTTDVLDRWDVAARTGSATDPASCAREVEWLAKLRLLEGMRRRDRLAWDHPRLAAMDLQWSDLRPERGLYHRLVAAGAVELLVTPEQVADAVVHPPRDTRAYFRGEAVARYGGRDLGGVSWDSVVFDVPGRRDAAARAHAGPAARHARARGRPARAQPRRGVPAGRRSAPDAAADASGSRRPRASPGLSEDGPRVGPAGPWATSRRS